MADVQGISPGYKVNPNAPGMEEALQWFLQQQAGRTPPMQQGGLPPNMTPQQLQQMIMIQQLRDPPRQTDMQAPADVSQPLQMGAGRNGYPHMAIDAENSAREHYNSNSTPQNEAKLRDAYGRVQRMLVQPDAGAGRGSYGR